jgi:hypothetical protein
MSGDAPRARNAGKKGPPGSNPRRPTQAQSLKRQLAIVADRDVEHLTFAEIARKHGLGEKEARAAYRRHVEEIAPLITATAPDERALEYLRELENVRQALWKLAASADNDSARVGALGELVKTLAHEIALQQHLGLMPRNPSELRALAEQRWRAQRLVQLLERYGLPAEAFAEIESIFSAERDHGRPL